MNSKLHPAITVGLVVLFIGALILIVMSLESDPTAEQSTTPTSSSESSSETTVRQYQDGTYSADGEYFSPGGQERIGVKITLKNGTITDTSLTKHADGGEAERYQEDFASSYKSEVVGKKIDDVKLSRVAGSSLTSAGFNKALEQIKDDAKA